MNTNNNDYRLSTLEYIEQATRKDGDHTIGLFKGYTLRSLFQPIYSISHGRIVGFESLVEIHDAKANRISPQLVYKECANLPETVFFDRLCRTIHVINFPWQHFQETWLFLNISPRVIIHGIDYGPFVSEMIEKFNIPSERLVIEVIESAIQDEARLAEAITIFHDLNCMIALDDFGAGHSNFERIWRLSPDIVKLDKIFFDQTLSNKRMQRILPNLVSLIHESGSLVLAEGIESETQALIAMDSDVDFVQGYFFGRPGDPESFVTPPGFFGLFDKFNAAMITANKQQHSAIAAYMNTFVQALDIMEMEHDIKAASECMFEHEEITRCYIVNAAGEQTQDTMLTAKKPVIDPRLVPIQKAEGANWFRRPYFRKAIRSPGQIQTTRPYLSIADSKLCITISAAYHHRGEMEVFCADIDWHSIDTDHFKRLVSI